MQNRAPSGTSKSSAVIEDGVYTFTDLDFGFSDPDDHGFAGIVLTTLPLQGRISLNGQAVTAGQFISASDIGASRLAFAPDSDENGTPYTSFTFQVRDDGPTGDGDVNQDPDADTFRFDVTSVDDPPVLDLNGEDAGDGSAAVYSENEGAVALAPAANLTDVDSAAFDGGDLSVSFAANRAEGDFLTILSAPEGDSGIRVEAGVVSHGGLAIGTVSGGTESSPLKITFNAAATSGAVEAVARAVAFGSTSDNPATEVRSISLVLTSGDGGIGAVSTASVTVNRLNDAPTFTSEGAVAAAMIYEDSLSATGQTIEALFKSRFNDADGDSFAGIAVVGNASSEAAGQWQYLGASDWVDIGAVSHASTLLLAAGTAIRFNPAQHFNGAAPALRVHLVDSSAGDWPEAELVSGARADLSRESSTGGTSAYSERAISLTQQIKQVNDAPEAANLSGDEVTFTEGDGAVRLDAGGNATLSENDLNGFQVRQVGSFTNPVNVAPVPDDSGRVFVVERAGKIFILDPATGQKSLFLDIVSQVGSGGERGLVGLATAPDYAASGKFYVFFSGLDGNNRVQSYTVRDDAPDLADSASADLILQIPHADVNVHNGGWLGFGPDGYLYISTGDGSFSSDSQFNAIDPNSLNGKILRIDVSRDDFADASRDYGIPADNPFAAGGGLGEVWALGLRNPFRASFDPETGKLYIADVGQDTREEVNVMGPGDAGANFGWSYREGTALYRGGYDDVPYTAPALEYNHGTGLFAGNSVTGGYVYRGPVESLQGKYIFGDFIRGNIWSVEASAIAPGTTLTASSFDTLKTAFAPNVGSLGFISSFGLDQAKNLYVANYFGGVFKMEPATANNFGAGTLTVSITAGKIAAEDQIRVDVSPSTAVTLSNATNEGSMVRVGGVLVGTIAPGGSGTGANDLVIYLSSGATEARLGSLMQALTYRNSNIDNPTAGTRTITYTLKDGAGTANGGQDTLTVSTSVMVTSIEHAAVARPDVFTTDEGTPVLGNLLGDNGAGVDTDRDGPELVIDSINGSAAAVGTSLMLQSGALLMVNSDGTFEYDPNGAFNALAPPASGAVNTRASDSFTYGLAGGNITTVTFNINGLENETNTLQGSSGSDELTGGVRPDTIFGDSGDDWIFGGGGDDYLYGGDGRDRLYGEAGHDHVVGGPEDDELYGQEGDDALFGRGGDDYLDGGDGRNRLYGEAGADTIAGGADDDIILGGEGEDELHGLGGADYVHGGAGEDRLYGGLGADVIVGDRGKDLILGQEGEDEVYGQDDDDYVDGGLGNDRLYGGSGNDLLLGGADTDTLYGEDGDDELHGGEGDDYVDGAAGADRLYGGGGSDILSGAAGGDELYGEDGTDEIHGREGDDYMDGGAGADRLYGGVGDDVLVGAAANDDLYGEDGRDELQGREGDDYMDGGAGADRLYGGSGNDVLVGGAANDDLYGEDGADELHGREGDDYMDGGAGADRLYGGVGNDVLVGAADQDQLYGEDGNDELQGREGADYLDGGTGNDRLYGGEGNDILLGRGGADDLYGGLGADLFIFDAAANSPAGAGGYDRIIDFTRSAGDLIDLSQIDANSAAAGDQEFTFLGTGTFTKTAGEVRYEVFDRHAYVSMDVNGDGIADATLVVLDVVTFQSQDFLF